MPFNDLCDELRRCQLCRDRFAQTKTAHRPRPVVWFDPRARVLIAGQAPGRLVHQSGQPFTDPSGQRLRAWLDLSPAQFYDQSRIAIVPMAFCFPGYSATGADLPPPTICARTWHGRVLPLLGNIQLRLVVGAHAIRAHLGAKSGVYQAVRDQIGADQGIFALPHPSWRNTAWLKKNPWFERDVLPPLRQRVRKVLENEPDAA